MGYCRSSKGCRWLGRSQQDGLKVSLRRGIGWVFLCATVAGCSADVTRFSGGPIYTGSTANQKTIFGSDVEAASAPSQAAITNPGPNPAMPNQIAAAPTNAASTNAALTGASPVATTAPALATQRTASQSAVTSAASGPAPIAPTQNAPIQNAPIQAAPIQAAPASTRQELPRQQPTFDDISRNAQASQPVFAPTQRQAAAQPAGAPNLAQQVDRTATGSLGAAATAPVATVDRYKGWRSSGGTLITIMRGDSLASLSQRYAIPVDVLAALNGMNQNAALQPGQRFVIPAYGAPVYGASDATRSVSAQPVSSEPTRPSKSLIPAETVKEAAQAATPLQRPITVVPQARPNRVAAVARTKSDVKSTTSGTVATSVAVPRPAVRPQQARSGTQSAPQSAPESALVTQSASVAPRALPAAPADALQRSQSDPQSLPQTFRWPAKGPIIAGFGDALGEGLNDGINISLPTGASIRAAADGEVIYAGDEIRNFGNLVLLSHPNGYVTAYAHADEITVRRGDRVSRGQIIAAAGTTGSVSEPQLHFEVRKGSSPIDPAPYLREQ